MKETLRIHLWSGPRNISTAMMYSFAQRNDGQVVDEPLYAHYLNMSGAAHPGREEVLASQENDGKKVIEWMSDFSGKPIVFFKQMTHHLIQLPLEFLSQTKNILLIRDPKEVLISYSKVIEQPTLSDIGIKQSFELFQFLKAKKFHWVILDAADVLRNPEAALLALCTNLEIEFQPAMLHWNAGARGEDGVWAKHWYKNVHQSTGFIPFREEERSLPDELKKVYDEAKLYYDLLSELALKTY